MSVFKLSFIQHAALHRQQDAVENGYEHCIWIIDASYIFYSTHGMKKILHETCKVYWVMHVFVF